MLKSATFTCSAVPGKGNKTVDVVVSAASLHEALIRVFQREGVDVGPDNLITIRDDFWGRENCLVVSRK